MTLSSIRDENCVLCKLSTGTPTSKTCIMGIGPAKPKLMVVSKLPLSDKGRRELDSYLTEAGIDPDSVFFTAVNRCKTWELEATKTDQKACKIYLDQEIDLIKPEFILALGGEALYVLTGKSGIMKYRGKTFPHTSGAKVIPTISPSMVLRNPGQLAGFVADLSFVKRASEGQDAPTAPPTRIRYATSEAGLASLTDSLKRYDSGYFDIETNRFEEYMPDSTLVTTSFTLWNHGDTEPQECWVVPLGHPESPFRSRWREVFASLREWILGIKRWVAHNGKFDARWFHQFGIPIQLKFDTMLAAHLLNENRPKGLKELGQALLGVAPWGISTKDLMNDPLKKVVRYNALDTWYGAHLYFVLRKQLLDQPRLAKLMMLEMVPASNVFVDIEREGIWTDRELLDTRAAIASRTLADIDGELRSLVPEDWRELSGAKEMNFNPSNFARWFLFSEDGLNLPVLERGKTKEDGTPGAPSMKESVMLKLAQDYPSRELELMNERTKWQKYDSSFFSAYQEQIDERDRIHTTFKLTGTVTGRLSSGKADSDKVTGRVQNRGVNLQQVPRDSFVRGIFGAPPGSVFVECDYSQVELRVAAFLAREHTMLHLYATGQDIHTTMAMQMTGKPESEVTKEERKKAKAVNFGFLYGMGWFKFIDTAWSNYGVVVSEDEAKAFRTAFFRSFPALQAWHQKQRRLARIYRRVESPLGRARHLPDIDSSNEGVRAEAERQAINSPVQSFASDMCVLALVRLSRQLKRMGYKAHSVGTVHDAINFEVPLDEVGVVVPLIRTVMEDTEYLATKFNVHLDVPIVADAKIGVRWGNALEVPENVSRYRGRLLSWIAENQEGIGLVR